MSKLKINNDLFLGKEELNRMNRFISELGYRKFLKLMTGSFGIVDGILNNTGKFKVTASQPNVKVAANSYAIDQDMNIIHNPSEYSIRVPNDNNFYWLKIFYNTSNLEEGFVSLSNDRTLSGNGTKFSEVLRGSPNYPSRIRLYDVDASGEHTIVIGEAEVNSVLSDTSAFVQISGEHANLRYAVVGTFTPGIVVSKTSKLIFEYDSVSFELVPELIDNTPPSKNEGEFFIARVKRSGTTITLSDRRSEFWELSVGEKSIQKEFYLGDPNVNNSWRILIVSNKLEFQIRTSGNWVTKHQIL